MHCVRIFLFLFLSFHLNLNPNISRSLSLASSPSRFLSFLPISWSIFSFIHPIVYELSRVVLMLLTMTAAAVATAIAIATYTTLLCVIQLSMLLAVRAKYLCLSVEFNSIPYVCEYTHFEGILSTHTLSHAQMHMNRVVLVRAGLFSHIHTRRRIEICMHNTGLY